MRGRGFVPGRTATLVASGRGGARSIDVASVGNERASAARRRLGTAGITVMHAVRGSFEREQGELTLRTRPVSARHRAEMRTPADHSPVPAVRAAITSQKLTPGPSPLARRFFLRRFFMSALDNT